MTTEKKAGAYLEITLKVNESDRGAAAAVYTKYRQPFLDTISGAVSKQLLVRKEDVQVLHGFSSVAEAEGYQSGCSGRVEAFLPGRTGGLYL